MTEALRHPPTGPFVVTPDLEPLLTRALSYLQAGLPVHLRGPAGTGKTAMALYLAGRLGQPVTLIYGNEEFRGYDLAGGVLGMRRRLMVDNFVHSVEKRVEEWSPYWVDARLLSVARHGGTLVYDEFDRSRAEANNILLAMLSEGVVEVPSGEHGSHVLPLHPDFRVIFTSNPKEYAGVHKSQDALQDRLVTLDVGPPGWDGLAAIVAVHTGLTADEAFRLIEAVRAVSLDPGRDAPLSVRPVLQIARVVCHGRLAVDPDGPDFVAVCHDLLGWRHSITRSDRSLIGTPDRVRPLAKNWVNGPEQPERLDSDGR